MIGTNPYTFTIKPRDPKTGRYIKLVYLGWKTVQLGNQGINIKTYPPYDKQR